MSCDQTRHHTLPSVDSIKYPRGITYPTEDEAQRSALVVPPPESESAVRVGSHTPLSPTDRAWASRWCPKSASAP